jgi:POT family proton-dependent oligopeptide transporter
MMNSSNPADRAPVSQTRSFSTVFLIEMWERFGYYGMAALLVLFMIDKLSFTDSHATLTWGAFTALVYASPSIGGWIGDKILGARRTMIFGAGVLAAGYFQRAIELHVRVARRDRGGQRPFQGECRESRAPHL